MLTFPEWLERYAPRDRAYSVVDLKEGWEGALRDFYVRDWEFRVVLPPTVNSHHNRGDWHPLPFVCIRPMLELFGAEIELRPVYMNRGHIEKGTDLLDRLNSPVEIPF